MMVNACPGPAYPTSSSITGVMPLVNYGSQPHGGETWGILTLCQKWESLCFHCFCKANQSLSKLTFYTLPLEWQKPEKIESCGLASQLQFHLLELWEICIHIQMSWLVCPPTTDSKHANIPTLGEGLDLSSLRLTSNLDAPPNIECLSQWAK